MIDTSQGGNVDKISVQRTKTAQLGANLNKHELEKAIKITKTAIDLKLVINWILVNYEWEIDAINLIIDTRLFTLQILREEYDNLSDDDLALHSEKKEIDQIISSLSAAGIWLETLIEDILKELSFWVKAKIYFLEQIWKKPSEIDAILDEYDLWN